MADILTGNAEALAAGSWVRENQGVASEQGFGSVSQFWYPQTQSFDEGIEFLSEKIKNRDDIVFKAKDLRFGEKDGKFVVRIEDRQFVPNEFGGKRLMFWLGMSEMLWNFAAGDRKDIGVLIHACNNAVRKADDDRELMARVYANDGCVADGTLRAVMSEKYAAIDNIWYLDVLKEFVPGGRLSHFSFCDGDTIYGNVLIPDTIRKETDSDYGGMLSISNCEITKRRLGQTPSIFRAICMNGCIWGQTKGEKVQQRHRGKIDLVDLRRKLAANIQEQIPLSVSAIDKLLDSRSWKLGVDMRHIFAAIVEEYGLEKQTVGQAFVEWNKNTGKERTAFGIVDGLTRAGQLQSPNEWVATDNAAGSIIKAGKAGWDKLNDRAKLLSEERIVKLLGA